MTVKVTDHQVTTIEAFRCLGTASAKEVAQYSGIPKQKLFHYIYSLTKKNILRRVGTSLFELVYYPENYVVLKKPTRKIEGATIYSDFMVDIQDETKQIIYAMRKRLRSEIVEATGLPRFQVCLYLMQLQEKKGAKRRGKN